MKKERMNSYNKTRPTSAPVLRTSKLSDTVLTSDNGDQEDSSAASEEKSQSKWQIRKSYLINFMMNSMIYMI